MSFKLIELNQQKPKTPFGKIDLTSISHENTFLDNLPSPLFLKMSIYSSENPPAPIELNTSGNKILKGQLVKEVINGTCKFDKLQIKEVSSHFRNGWIFIVVTPVVSMSKYSSKFGTTQDDRMADVKCRQIMRDMK